MATYQSQARDQLTYVKVSGNGAEVYYGFKTIDLATASGVSTQDLTALGHVKAGTLADGALTYLRANAPKPARAKKTIKKNPTVSEKGSTSTFCAYGKEKDARAAGWDIVKGRRGVSLNSTTRYVTAIAQLSNGLLYVFPMNKAAFTANSQALGLKDPATIKTATERDKLVRGCSTPRPGKAKLVDANGKSVTSFYSTANIGNLLDTGWTILTEEIL